MAATTSEDVALASIADVLAESRALVIEGVTDDYRQALVDLTMLRLRNDVEFLIFSSEDDEPGTNVLDVLDAVPPPNGHAEPVVRWWVIDHPSETSVIHADEDCSRLRSALGIHPASRKDIASRDKCKRCAV
jgi:hypothetical protein